MYKDKLLVGLVLILTCHFVINVTLSAIAGATTGVVFNHRIGDVSKNHTIQVTPEGFTFFIWNIIYLWLISAYAFISYNLICLDGTIDALENDSDVEDGEISPRIRISVAGDKTGCSSQPVFGRYVTCVMILNSIAYTSWLFLWDMQLMSASAVALTCICVTNWVALVILSISLWKNSYELKSKRPCHWLWYIISVQNGMAVYTAWTTLASLINISVALVYDGDVEDASASLIALVVLTILMGLWFPLELIFWDKYFRYMITPFPVVLWALFGIYTKQRKNPDRIDNIVSLYTIILMICTGCLIIFRIICMIYRHFKRPLLSVNLSRRKRQIS